MKNTFLYIILGILIVAAVLFLIKNKNISFESSKEPEPKQTAKSQDISEVPTPKMAIDKTRTYSATLKTEKGDIVISLMADKTPITVNNFVTLAKKGFYDNTVFHRVIPGFMIQGGDPKGDGTGGPGYRFDDEPFAGEYTRGTVAMANAGPNTNGSQFFIMHKDYDLPKNYVIFASVTNGLDVVDSIAQSELKDSPSGEKSTPVKAVKVVSVEIAEN